MGTSSAGLLCLLLLRMACMVQKKHAPICCNETLLWFGCSCLHHHCQVSLGCRTPPHGHTFLYASLVYPLSSLYRFFAFIVNTSHHPYSSFERLAAVHAVLALPSRSNITTAFPVPANYSMFPPLGFHVVNPPPCVVSLNYFLPRICTLSLNYVFF